MATASSCPQGLLSGTGSSSSADLEGTVACSAATGLSASSSPNLMMHLLMRGTFMMSVSLLSCVASALMMTKYNEKVHSEEQARQEGVEAAYAPHRAVFLPLEAFGLDYNASWALRGVAALMRRLGPGLEAAAERMNVSLVVSAACVPVGLYYWVRVLLARIAPEVRPPLSSSKL